MKVVGREVRSNYYPRVTCDLGKIRHNTEEVMRGGTDMNNKRDRISPVSFFPF